MFRSTSCLVTAVLLFGFGRTAEAASIEMVRDLGDGVVGYQENLGPIGGSGGTRVRIGRASDPGQRQNKQAVYFFELPLLVSGQTVTSANLSFSYPKRDDNSVAGPPSFSVDLYGLGWVSAPQSLDTSWYWNSNSDDTRTGDNLGTNIGTDSITKIQDRILTTTQAGSASSTSLGIVETDASGDTQLSVFIGSLYDHGAQAGDFAVLRLTPDKLLASDGHGYGWNFGYVVSFAEDAGYEPVLTLNVIPEPSTFILLTIGAVSLLVYGWRRRR